jgi:hypothetical protein
VKGKPFLGLVSSFDKNKCEKKTLRNVLTCGWKGFGFFIARTKDPLHCPEKMMQKSQENYQDWPRGSFQFW